MSEREFAYLIVEQVVIESKEMTASDKRLYTAIKSFRNRKTGLCYPSIKKIMERAGMSKLTVLHSLKNLRSLGIIDYRHNEGWKEPNRYRFILEDGKDDEIASALEKLGQMVQKETIVEGAKKDQRLEQNRTIKEMAEKVGSKTGMTAFSADSPMVHMGTPNHLNQKKEPKEAGPLAPPTRKAVGLRVSHNDEDDNEPTEAEIEAVIKESRNRIGPVVAKRVARDKKAKSMGNREA